MEVGETLRMASRSVRSHKLRSALTVVGVVIGIASVVTFATFGASVKADIVSDVGSSSASDIYALPTATDDDGGFGGGVGQPVFTAHDVEQLQAIEGARAAVPRGNVPVSELRFGNDSVSQSQILATTPRAFPADSVVAGRAFRSGAREVVVNRAATGTFDRNVSVGDSLTITLANGTRSRVAVVGIVNRTVGELPFTSFAGGAQFYVPVEPFYQQTVESPATGTTQRAYPQVTVVADPARIDGVRERVRTYLRGPSDAAELVPESVEPSTQTSGDFVDRVASIIDRVTRFVTGIGVIALVVAAVGIANIMLVSVAERTREIGIMKAVGARNRDVMALFLTEATLLGVVGAIVGLPLGVAVAYGATLYAEVAFTPAYGWFAIAVAVGILVGVLAGLYPAWRAARIDPIDALRYE